MVKRLSKPIQLVWFKRDLRLHDHAPLWEAAQRGPVLPLFIVEPSVVHAPDYAARHWSFTRRALLSLREDLAALGQPLVVRVGEVVPTLQKLCAQFPITAVWAHEETGNMLTFERDIAVRRWAKSQRLPLHELPQNGVVRALRDRDQWAGLREQFMRQSPSPTVQRLKRLLVLPGKIPTHEELGLPPETDCDYVAGETAAFQLLNSFLTQRSTTYVRGMSSPLTAPDVCSRLSPHLAYGTLSLRTAVQATRRQINELRPERNPKAQTQRRALEAFESRLAWRSHFMQKLEMEPRLEFENLVEAFDGMRGADEARLAAWRAGETGYPMVDACMRMLNVTGWLNFRMRAMLVTFASFDLWQHWREPSLHLARQFVDYEPGIHYSQMQMQGGTTGNRTVRIYSPTKQGQEHDPNGLFVRRWLPELTAVPTSFIHAPWLMPTYMQQRLGVVLGKHYPQPIVEPETAVRQARQAFALVHNSETAVGEAQQVRQKHGSRKQQNRRRQQARKRPNPDQLRLL